MSTKRHFETAIELAANDVARDVSPASASAATKRQSFPRIHIQEEDEHVVVLAVVPGFTREDLRIDVQRDVLALSGRVRCQVPQGFTALQKGRTHEDFSRHIKLMTDVSRGETEARLERGVLTVRMRKHTAALRTPIPVRVP
ncbi:MAG TPA: Hsp20/alpha crystallin family protein [Polyangiaceae bacterium]|nr:Hsp20/alpha crystallin family protein [Polyangiaceae bacterium]